MSKTFNYKVNTAAKELFNNLKAELSKHGGIDFNGDENSGRISGKGFAGSYELTPGSDGTSLSITISKKPFYAPWGMIESGIRDQVRKL